MCRLMDAECDITAWPVMMAGMTSARDDPRPDPERAAKRDRAPDPTGAVSPAAAIGAVSAAEHGGVASSAGAVSASVTTEDHATATSASLADPARAEDVVLRGIDRSF